MPNWTIALITFLAAIVGAVAVISYNMITSTPNIKGQICQVIQGNLIVSKQGQPDKTYTLFTVLLYLTNTRGNSVHILDYELEIDFGKGFERVDKVYGIEDNEAFYFEPAISEDGKYSIDIPDYTQKLIYKNNKPVEYGKPIYGIIAFATEKQTSHDKEIRKYRITCVDAFGRRHQITYNVASDEFMNIYLLKELFGLKLTQLN